MSNFKIFPAHLNREGQKVPLIKGWNELASNDPNQIKLWQELYRDRISFWGVPCGQANGIYVLDIDVKKANGWQSLQNLGYQIPETLRQDTPSGGSHFFFKTQPGKHYPNTVNSGLGLDTRGDRGWVAWYGLVNNVPLVEAPDWLFKLAPDKPIVETNVSPIRLAPEIAQGIFQASLDAVRNAPEGESNDTLNREAFRVGQLVSSQSISREFAFAELFKAAKDRGKPDYEAKATIESGLNGGAKHPLTSPFGTTEPQATITLPAPPEAPERWTPKYLTRHDLLNTSKLRKPQLFLDWSTEDISITTADGGTGKTTLKLNEAICLALGDRFLGFECKQRGKTLYITGEDTDKKLAAMLGAIMKQMGLMDDTPENNAKVDTVLSSIVIKKDSDLCLIAKDRQGFLYPNKDAMQKVIQAIEDINPKLIVFDPIASFWGSESALNDMNKAVTRFMSDIVEKYGVSVEMINHMGKSSSASKDMTQFAGRGGSGLPSNSRVSRVLRALPSEEYSEMTGAELIGDQTAMLCNVNKFSDGSPLLGKPFIVIRNGYLFSKITLSPQKAKEVDKKMDDLERVYNYIKTERDKNKYPTRSVVIGHFMTTSGAMSADRVKRSIDMLVFQGYMGDKIMEVENPDLTVKHKALIISDQQ